MAQRTIAEEIKQTRPFRARSQEAVVALLRTAHLVRRRLESLTSSQGISLQQYNVLRILRGAGAPMPTMDIAERMIETSCGITRLVTTLEEKGLVRREQWAGDRRQFLCQLTPAGTRLVGRLDDPMDRLDDQLLALSHETLATFLEALSEIRQRSTSERGGDSHSSLDGSLPYSSAPES